MKKIALLIDGFNASICEIENSDLNDLLRLDKKIKLTNNYLQQFRIIIRNNGFNSRKNEIHFFKYQKPFIQVPTTFDLDPLNNRPRKRHQYKTPIFVMEKLLFNSAL